MNDNPELVHVGWWCWRGDNHGHLATTACRSDNVPIHVPAEWADEMRTVIQRIEDGDDDQPDPEANPQPVSDEFIQQLATVKVREDTETEAPPVCQGFVWIGQSFATCDRCGQPAWEHAGEEVPAEGAGPFDNGRTVRPWKPGQADAIRAKWGAPERDAAAQQPKEARS